MARLARLYRGSVNVTAACRGDQTACRSGAGPACGSAVRLLGEGGGDTGRTGLSLFLVLAQLRVDQHDRFMRADGVIDQRLQLVSLGLGERLLLRRAQSGNSDQSFVMNVGGHVDTAAALLHAEGDMRFSQCAENAVGLS